MRTSRAEDHPEALSVAVFPCQNRPNNTNRRLAASQTPRSSFRMVAAAAQGSACLLRIRPATAGQCGMPFMRAILPSRA